MNVPNQLTIGRLFLTVGMVLAVASEIPFRFTIGLLLFLVASLTDFLDGYLARRDNIITAFGKLMDPLADKVLMAAAFVILCEHKILPGWFVIAVVTREFLVTGLRLLATSKGAVLAADSWGKLKTVLQIALAIYGLGFLAAPEVAVLDSPLAVPKGLSIAATALLWVTLVITLGSGFRYVWDNRSLIDQR